MKNLIPSKNRASFWIYCRVLRIFRWSTKHDQCWDAYLRRTWPGGSYHWWNIHGTTINVIDLPFPFYNKSTVIFIRTIQKWENGMIPLKDVTCAVGCFKCLSTNNISVDILSQYRIFSSSLYLNNYCNGRCGPCTSWKHSVTIIFRKRSEKKNSNRNWIEFVLRDFSFEVWHWATVNKVKYFK